MLPASAGALLLLPSLPGSRHNRRQPEASVLLSRVELLVDRSNNVIELRDRRHVRRQPAATEGLVGVY